MKHNTAIKAVSSTPLVKEEYPLKQGLKLSYPAEPDVLLRGVKEEYPLKQGLKPLNALWYRSYPNKS